LLCSPSDNIAKELCSIDSCVITDKSIGSGGALVRLGLAFNELFWFYNFPEIVMNDISTDIDGATLTFRHKSEKRSEQQEEQSSTPGSSGTSGNCGSTPDHANASGYVKEMATIVLNVSDTSLVSADWMMREGQCALVLDVSGVYPTSHLSLYIGIPIAAVSVVFLLATIYFVYRIRHRKALLQQLEYLPKETRKFYMDAIIHPNTWEKVNSSPILYRKELTTEKDLAYVSELFSLMEGDNYKIKRVYAVFNPMLVSTFSLAREKMISRAGAESASMFMNEAWRKSAVGLDRKNWVQKALKQKIALFPWNTMDSDVPVVGTCHGTSLSSAWKICQNGFATLASFDSGFYGSGIYFTTRAMYCYPYLQGKKDPSIILSWVILGNSYPVTEHPDHPGSLLGQVIKPGYQSHYVCTDNCGFPYPYSATMDKVLDKTVFDEIVINQESQVTPAFIIVVGPSPKLSEAFSRALPTSYNTKKAEEGDPLEWEAAQSRADETTSGDVNISLEESLL